MSYIDPKVKPRFDSLSDDLRHEILRRDVQLYTLTDLIRCLEDIIAED